MTSLTDIFSRIEDASSVASRQDLLAASPFPDGTDRHVAKDSQGRPVILVCVRRRASETIPVNYVLENLRIAHERKCRIRLVDGREREDFFTIIECQSDDHSLQSLFLRSMEALLATCPDSASLTEISAALENLVLLFQALKRPQARPIVGLWGELWLIASAFEPVAVLRAWHESPLETSDFSAGEQRLEVKSSSDRTRRHHFSLEQAHAPEGTSLIIASLLIESVASGTSLGELWDRVRDLARTDSNLVLKTDRVCIESLGAEWEEARHRCFDVQRASQSLLLFDSSSIPRISIPLSAGVTEVHFRSDLSLCEPLSLQELVTAGGLFGHLLRGR